MSLFQMSVSGGVLILFIAVVRALAIKRLPKTTFLILWVIAALRLLLPFSVPTSFGIGIGFDIVQTAPDETIALTLSGEELFHNLETAVNPAVTIKYTSTIFVFWLIGAILATLYFFVSYIRSIKKFKMSVPDDTPYIKKWLSSHKILRNIEVRSSDLITSPLTYGVLRPVILLPKKLDRNNRAALDCILTHEYIHIRRFDAITKILFASALCIHWLNPLVWVMYTLADRDMELSCDVCVIRRMGEKNRSSYALMLIDMAEQQSGICSLHNYFGKNAIKERIESIMKFKKTSAISLGLAMALTFGAITVFATSERQEQEYFMSAKKGCENTTDSDNSEIKLDNSSVSFAPTVEPDGSDFILLDHSEIGAEQYLENFRPKKYSDEEWEQIIADIESGKIPEYRLSDLLEGNVPGVDIPEGADVTVSIVDIKGCLSEAETIE